jgi:ABC-type transporter Mla MlaB component
MKSTIEDGVLKISPSGPLGSAHVASHAAAIASSLEGLAEGGLAELDLSQSGPVDSSTIRLLIATDRDCRHRSIDLQVICAEENTRLLRLLRLERRVKLIATEEKS